MTERIIIFIVIASAIVAITLIAALMQIIKSICEVKATKYSMVSMGILSQMGGEDAEPKE